ncbi:MAG: choline kinase [Gammaproteobacteria bacterium]|jgi:choline kinase
MTLHCVILGAGAPHQGDSPALLEQVDGVSVLDWLLNALALPEEQIQLVLGYQSTPVAAQYGAIRTLENPHWESTGSTASLLEADLDGVSRLLVCYGDILFRHKVVDQLTQSDAAVSVAWDSLWKQRYIDRELIDMALHEKVKVHHDKVMRLGDDLPVDWADGEFIGLAYFSGASLDVLRRLQKSAPDSLKQCHLSGLVEWLRAEGTEIAGLDVGGDWAEVNQPKDIAHFVLGTKAETLARLRQMIRQAVIQDQVAFTVKEWCSNASQILARVRGRFAETHVVVRSSARSEDSFTHSNAGAYTSLLNIDPQQALAEAIDTVIDSYGVAEPEDQVLVQPMVQDVRLSGVLFSRTLEFGAPYYVINYDDSGATDGITGGSSTNHQTLYVRRDADTAQLADPRLEPLVKALKEIENLLAYDALDVEFAIDSEQCIHILQVRPIAVEQQTVQHSAEVIQLLQQAESDWKMLQHADPHLLGSDALYGVMPDWNPAEIIGTHPGSLAESIYRYLILDEVWATQRAEYGYRDVRPKPLLVNFAGKPYIDVRASFNSFIPADLPEPLAKRLVEFCLSWLKQHPHLHDKVEFEVIPTCCGLDFGYWEQRLIESGGFNQSDTALLKASLMRITSHAIERTASDIEHLARMDARFAQLVQPSLPDEAYLLTGAQKLLDACRLYGTLPFAHLARSAFVAITLLKDAVTTGVISESAKEQFLGSLRTVSHELSQDARATAQGKLTQQAFIERHGHLRPGTYDIVSQAYHEDPDTYLLPLIEAAREQPQIASATNLWDEQKSAFFEAIRQVGFEVTDDALECFLRSAIEGREKAKFGFTRGLSKALDLLVDWGASTGLSREVLANLSLNDLFDSVSMQATRSDRMAELRDKSDQRCIRRQLSMACELPALITDRRDFYSFLQIAGMPNFIGSERIIADCCHLGDASFDTAEVEGRIVLIPQADPGYDWLFGRHIAGLVTLYGGANSHMAIRAAEFGLPAAIGIGEQRYQQLSGVRSIELDPGNAILRAVLE